MRMLVVAHTSLVSGAEIALQRVVDAARLQGWKVMVAVPPGAFSDRLSSSGTPVVRLPELKLPAGPRPLAMCRLIARTARAAGIVRRHADGADVVLVNGLLGLPAVRAARLVTPVVWIVHDVHRTRQSTALLRWVAGAVDRAVGVSEAAAGPVRAAGIQTTVVHNGTTWPVEPAPPDVAGPPVVGCIGVLTPWKGHRVLLQAMRRLPGVQLEVVGAAFPKDAAYAAGLRALAQEPDLAGRVRFLGQVADPLLHLRQWAVLVSPSTDPETGPLVMLEAMSVGVPVVATAHGGPVELLGEAGLLVTPGDAEALAGAVDELLRDPERRRRMGATGRRMVAERFQVEHRMTEMLAVVQDAISASARPSEHS
jgi:glycosyltransferase involved in cell wall biosynthesis